MTIISRVKWVVDPRRDSNFGRRDCGRSEYGGVSYSLFFRGKARSSVTVETHQSWRRVPSQAPHSGQATTRVPCRS